MSRTCVALVLVLAACGDDGASTDAGVDADRARTDLVPAIGSPDTLDVACWNLRMFPGDVEAGTLVGDLIASMQLDVVAVQEIENKSAFEAAIARLPGWQLAMPDAAGSATGGIALAWNTEVVQSISTDVIADARLIRPIVRGVFEVNAQQFALHAVHLKAGTQAADEAARIEAAAVVEGEVRSIVDTTEVDRVLVLGDFNEDFDDPRADEMFAVFTADRYAVISRSVDDAGGVTFLPANVMLDQMVATTALAPAASTPIIPPLAQQLPDYRTRVSDHVPLVVKLAL